MARGKSDLDPGVVEVRIQLRYLLERFSGQSQDADLFRSFVSQALEDLCSDLGLPAVASLTIFSTNAPDDLNSDLWELTIDGVRARRPFRVEGGQVDAATLGRSVQEALCLNRELFVTPDLARGTLVAWSGPSSRESPGAPATEFFHFLQEIVRRGCRIARARALLPQLLTVGLMSNPARAAECCLSSLDVLAVKLLLNKDWYDEVQISLSEAAVKGVPVETPKGDLAAALEHTREAMYFELGVVIPRVRVELDDSLGNNEFRIQLNDMRLPRVVAIDRNEFLVDEAPVRLPLLNLSGRLVLNPSTGTEASAVRDERGARERCEQAGLTVWGAAEFISLAFTRAIRRNADLLMSRELAEIQLSQLREVFPDLVRITQQRVQIEDFTLILRDLLRSGLSIRDLRGISEALLFDTSLEKSGSQVLYTPHVVEALRESRCKELFYHHAGISPLVVCLIDGRIEQALGNRTLGTLDRGQVLETMCHTLAGPLSTGQLPKLLTHGGIRRDIHDMVRIELPDVTVLSYEELPPGLNVGVPTGPERRIDIFPLFQIETTRSWSPESDQDLLEGELKSVWEQMARLEEIRSFSTAGLSDEDMAVVYAKGYYLFLHGCYEPAQSLFRRLAEFAPHNVAYWRALGVMHQKLGDYERAIFAFNQAVSVDDAEIVSRLYRAESYILSDNKGAAIPDLDEILRLASGDPELDVWTKRAELLLVVHRDAANQR